ncbi:MAG: SDR family NAD(P)-dependent oxidoreductase [Acidimicrobiales bacterium]
MIASRTTLRRVADAMLEASVVASFTKIGPEARSELFDWDEPASNMTGSTVLVTGGSSGIGRSIAEQLVSAGAHVVLTSRSLERAQSVAADLNATNPSGRATGAEVDTGDLGSVHALAQHVAAETEQLDVLIHNAGALTDDYRANDRGVELTLASHLVGPYALTLALRPHLAPGARVLWMASGGMYTQKLDVDRIQMSADDYRGAVAYARAKRGQVELVDFLGRAWAPDVQMHAMHPGWVDTDGVAQALPGFGKLMGPLLRSTEQGADTMVWLACGGADDAVPGQFWLDRRPRSTTYLPRTGTDDWERARLVAWLDAQLAD